MRTLLMAALTLALLQGVAQAQFNPAFRTPQFGPGYRTNLSPYLNLLRGGDFTTNYFLGTRPEQQRRQQAARFGNEILDLQDRTRVGGEEFDRAPIVRSGTTPYLNNTGGYFNNTSGFFANPQTAMAPISRPGSPVNPVRKPGTAFRPGPSSGTIPLK